MKRETFTTETTDGRKTHWNVNPLHQERRKSDLKPDGTVDLEGNIGDEFEQVLDELNDHLTGRNKSLPAERHDPIDQERHRREVESELRILQAAMKDVLTEKLTPTGLIVEGVVSHNQTYDFTFFVRDSAGRRFDHDVSVGTMDAIWEQGGLPRVIGHIVQHLLAARDAYHTRVNQVMGVGN